MALGISNEDIADTALITTRVQIETPTGHITAHVLIDSGAETNFLSQKWAKTYLPDTPTSRPHKVKAVDGHRIQSYGGRTLVISATDTNQFTRQALHAFEAVDIEGYDFILGLPWLKATNPDIDWDNGTWKYREAAQIQIMHPSKAIRKVLKGNAAFLINPIDQTLDQNVY